MKKDPKLRDMLIATVGCIILTLLQFFGDRFMPSYRSYRNGLELLILWLVVAICWIIYLVRSRKSKNEKDPWNRKEKDPW